VRSSGSATRRPTRVELLAPRRSVVGPVAANARTACGQWRRIRRSGPLTAGAEPTPRGRPLVRRRYCDAADGGERCAPYRSLLGPATVGAVEPSVGSDASPIRANQFVRDPRAAALARDPADGLMHDRARDHLLDVVAELREVPIGLFIVVHGEDEVMANQLGDVSDVVSHDTHRLRRRGGGRSRGLHAVEDVVGGLLDALADCLDGCDGIVAATGPERGRDATAEALAYGWEHWARVRRMANPLGYLYRVGQSRSRSRKRRVLTGRPNETDVWVEPRLLGALAGLSQRQRVVTILVHGFGWTMSEVAELTGVSLTTVQNHLERGLAALRSALEVREDV
jgi:DNA-directed RNA polymerase specialized sigma24 family protein